MHQTVIGEEALKQFAAAGESAPDLIVGCTGGGSNFAGLFFPFLREKLAGRANPVIRAVEPSAARRSPGAGTPTTSATPPGSPRC